MTAVPTLVICLGNVLRGDDGFGPAVGERLGELGVPQEGLRIVGELLPELAADVAAADAVLFVDAAADLPPGELRVSRVMGPLSAARWTHRLAPSELLALASAVYGRVPPALLVGVGGEAWDLGAALSAAVAPRVADAAALVMQWRTSPLEAAENPASADNELVDRRAAAGPPPRTRSGGPVHEQLDTLQHSRLFQNVPHALASSILATSTTRTLAAGDMLLHAGQPNDMLYVVLSGRLGVLLGGPAGPRHVQITPGECVGELSVIDGNPVSADVVAEERSDVLGIDGDELWAVLDASPEMARNLLFILSGRVRHDTTVLTESARLRLHFERVATVDGLTGLRNRRWLDEAFARQLTRTLRRGDTVSLLMIDVDGFKGVNDAHGHLIGDAVLCRVARVLAERLRPQDLLARYAGDEFLLMLPGCDIDEATRLADRLRTAVAASSEDPGHEPLPPTTVSIGVATARLSDSLPALIGLADSALYRAKDGGRNRISR